MQLSAVCLVSIAISTATCLQLLLPITLYGALQERIYMMTTEIETNENKDDEIFKQRVRNNISNDVAAANKNENHSESSTTFSETPRLVFSLQSNCRSSTLLLHALSPTVFVAPALVTLKGIYQHFTFHTTFSSSNSNSSALFPHQQLAALARTLLIPSLTSFSTPIKLITMFEHNAKNRNEAKLHSKMPQPATTTATKTKPSSTASTISAFSKRLYEPTPIEQLLTNHQKKPPPPSSLRTKKLKTSISNTASQLTAQIGSNNSQSDNNVVSVAATSTETLKTATNQKIIPAPSVSTPVKPQTVSATKEDVPFTTENSSATTSTSSSSTPLHTHKKQKRVFKPVIIHKRRKSGSKNEASIASSSTVSNSTDSTTTTLKQVVPSTTNTSQRPGEDGLLWRAKSATDDDEEDVPLTKPLTLTEKRKRQAARADQLKFWRVREEREARAARLLLRKQILSTPSISPNINRSMQSLVDVGANSRAQQQGRRKKRVRFNLSKNNTMIIPGHDTKDNNHN